ncbi:uncharacterized protein CELE_F43C11.3 [Caenorhabditis elegans]|uniref:Uncharacterized protein n=1 Tax=Caenorhabditis elegans TaxID=6239 RepID=Q9U5B5_CAEEL|nr:Uncharacterized protein CELE_F43C11.3 [Caenorhabditis elegans]CCD69617.1 Uncharacterized protein CELE_F43C11.3 [Caenorhabditis elegans]|eukprot:NP_494251.1 DiEnoyl-CoA Reductase, mitochondria [Caenorhabditis elegans]
MNFLIIFSILISYISSQAIPNVVLTGEPRVIARRILNVDMKTAQQLVHPDNQMHVKYQVNVVKNPENLATESSGYITEERTPVTIYRRILRPARITFNEDRVVTDNVQGTSDAVEMESWTLNKSPTIDGSFVQQGAFH